MVKWQSILNDLPPEEKRQLVAALKVDGSTLSRWISGKSRPGKPQYLRDLAALVPGMEVALLEISEFAEILHAPLDDPDNLQIPASYYKDVIGMLSNTSRHVLNYTITKHVYEYVVSQMDLNEDGLMLLFIQCVEPDTADEKVTRLYVAPGRGTGPWKVQQIEHSFCIGRGTLSAVSVENMRPAFHPQDFSFQRYAPLLHQDRIHSVGVFPVTRNGYLAGLLFLASVHPDFFTPVRKGLAQDYADLLALGLRDYQFYPPERIKLQEVPAPKNKTMFLEHFHAMVAVMLKKHPEYQNLSQQDLEQLVIRDFDMYCEEKERDYA